MAYVKIRPRRSSKAEWEHVDPILAEGEWGIEYPNTGIGTGSVNMKFGDGIHKWTELPYAIEGAPSTEEIAELSTRIIEMETFINNLKPYIVVTSGTPIETINNAIQAAKDTNAVVKKVYYNTELQSLANKMYELELEMAVLKSMMVISD